MCRFQEKVQFSSLGMNRDYNTYDCDTIIVCNLLLHHEGCTMNKNNGKSAQRRHKNCMLAVVRWSEKFHIAADPVTRGRGTAKI